MYRRRPFRLPLATARTLVTVVSRRMVQLALLVSLGSAAGGAATFDSGKMEPGDVFRHTFQVPGVYKYVCLPHEMAGMLGLVEVEPAGDEEAGDEEATDPATARQATGGAEAREGEADAGHGGEAEGAEDDRERRMILGTHNPPRPEDYEEATGLLKFLYWLGKSHPAATDLPVGVTIAAFVSEILLLVTGRQVFAAITRFSVWLAGLSAAGVAFGGWCLAGFRLDDPHWMLETHRWWGTGFGLGMLGLIVLVELASRKQSSGMRWLFRLALLAAVVVVGVTGFYGGAMIYGLDHYAWPNSK